jgi:hypothetical protein
MIPDYDTLWRRWFLIDPDGERTTLGPFNSKEEAERFWAGWHDNPALEAEEAA